MKSPIKVILFSLTGLLFFASMFQKITYLCDFKKLNGVEVPASRPAMTFQKTFEEVVKSEAQWLINYSPEKFFPPQIEAIREKVKQQGKTFEQAIRDDAKWIVNQKDDGGYLAIPWKKT